jgi:GT2 family glycosyltransferase
VDGKFFARGDERLRIQGVTYGPFAKNSAGEPFPERQQAQADFESMRAASINAIRTYHLAPGWLLEAASENELSVLVDIPWSKHLCFLDSRKAQAEARQAVRQTVEMGRPFPAIFGLSIGNEIPATIVRWHGARRIERFLRELADVARQADPHTLITYANYPSTEYLDLSFTDFVTFNVYLHDREVFRRYLHRLQNLVGDKPLLLGELGMDSQRNGEVGQADFLAGHLREVTLQGLAGGFVFSWTDDWHTGGHQIEDWAFGITDRQRNPKPSYHAVREVFEGSPASLVAETPKVSVVVCSYNGGATLDECLRSLREVDYPHYEVIVVDDGSTDDTGEILERFPEVKAIRQINRGLSAARNVGLEAATGSIVAYTDSDCFVDRDWLTLLVDQLQRSGASAVGGPNLTPDDGWLASCVAACPGQPMHVLKSDQVAEHIPGCNMAFRRDALLAISGFDYQYRKAGDDVDICWRLEQAGYWITFAPGAFVWHHRRQTPLAFLKQQAGYGEAEALLRFQHPDRYNAWGDGKWNGVLYGASLRGLCLDRPLIYSGMFGTGMFQCIYQPQPAHWAMFPSTLEWHLGIALCALAAVVWPYAAAVALAMWLASLLVAALLSFQARLPARYHGFLSRLVVMFLCYAQPLVRSWRRQRTRLFSYHRSTAALALPAPGGLRMPLLGSHTVAYWSEEGLDRLHLLSQMIERVNERRWTKTIDTGWECWDLDVLCHPWAVARLTTVQEEHGGGKRLVRVRYEARPSGYTRVLWGLGTIVGALGLVFWSWPVSMAGAALLATTAALYWRGARRAAATISLVDSTAIDLGFVRCVSARVPAAQPPHEKILEPCEKPANA